LDKRQPEGSDNLRANEERYRTVFELAPDIIFGLSVPDGAFTDLSPSFEIIVGSPVSDWIGKPFMSIVHAADLPLAEEIFRMIVRGEVPPRHELRIHTKAGGYVIVEIRAVPRLESGRVVGGFGIARDITRRKRMEEVQNLLVEAGKVLALSRDPQETLDWITRLAVPVLGDWAQSFVIEEGQTKWRTGAHVDPRRGVYLTALIRRYPLALDAPSPLARVVRSGQAVLVPVVTDDLLRAYATNDAQLRLLRALTPRSAMIVPLSVHERTLGAMAIVSSRPGYQYDLEDLAIADLLAQRASLAVENARLFAAERRARTLAEAAVRERDEFLTIVAHELKTPITSLLGYSQLFTRHFDRGSTYTPNQVRGVLRVVVTQGSRLARLVNRLLSDSRLAAGTLTLVKERVDLSALVERVGRDMQETTTEHAIAVQTPGKVNVTIDPLHIEQVMANVLDNAIRYSPNGGPIEVAVSEPSASGVRVSVCDHGIGVPTDQREHLFDRFNRAHANSYQSGLGIGLYTSRQIVELHGGQIAAEFPPGGGTCFVVTLPIDHAG